MIDDHLELVDMRLVAAEYLVKIGAPKRRGSVGFVRYALADPAGVPATARSAVDALARFACYAGIGDRTASGMGYAVIDPAGGVPADDLAGCGAPTCRGRAHAPGSPSYGSVTSGSTTSGIASPGDSG